MCTPVFFITALFIVVKTWKQPKYTSRDEWINKMWHIYAYICVYIMECYSAIKRMKYCYLHQHGWTERMLYLVK